MTQRHPGTVATEHHHPPHPASGAVVDRRAGHPALPDRCATGEVAGMVIGTAAGLHNAATVGRPSRWPWSSATR